MTRHYVVTLAFLALVDPTLSATEPGLPPQAGMRSVQPNQETGTAQAVVVDPVALAHTCQLLPLDEAGHIVGKDDPTAQIDKVLQNVATALSAARTGFDSVVKVNVYVRRADVVPQVQKALAKRFAGAVKPAVTYVEGILTHPDALVAMDAVAAVADNKATDVKRSRSAALAGPKNGAHVAVLPLGPQLHVSGQAGKGEDVIKATRQTMKELHATLKYLNRDETHVVQVKAFLNPMSAAADVEKEIAACFADQTVPPLVFVEWKYDLVEVELVVAGWNLEPSKDKSIEAIEFLTPPGVDASPVYSRVAQINRGKLIYISGLHAKGATKPEAEVQEVFAALTQLLDKTGSDSRHLAKATYYVTDEEVTTQLGAFRKKYYDPKRPPAASKAKVSGVGFPGNTLTIDMIAVATR